MALGAKFNHDRNTLQNNYWQEMWLDFLVVNNMRAFQKISLNLSP